MFLQVAVGAIGIGIVLMVGYLVIANVKAALPTPQVANECLGLVGSDPDCAGLDNTSMYVDDATYVEGTASTQATVYAGFGLVAVGIIVLAAFALINVFK